MLDARKEKLIDLGPKALADALLNFTVHSDEANDLTYIPHRQRKFLIFKNT